MATTRMALGSLMSTVANTAEAASSVVNTISGSANMLNDFVQRHRTMQQDRNIIEIASFRERLIEETAREETVRKEALFDYFAAREGRKANFDSAYEKLQNLFPKTNQETEIKN